MNHKTRMTNKALGAFLCLIMLLSLVQIPAAAQDADSSVTTYSVSDYDALKSRINDINAAKSGEYIISLADDITINESSLTALILKAPVTVTIIGNGKTITGTGTKAMFYVQNGATLILGDADNKDTLVLDANEQGYGIDVTKGTLKMYDGVTIKNAKSKGKGGVYVSGSSSAFYMYGGTITNCHVTNPGGGDGGGGIAARSKSRLEIEEGTISYCSAGKSGGGIYVDSNASAIIKNATITHNTAGVYNENPSTNYGMSYWGGGIAIGEGAVTIENCQITNNTVHGWRGGGIWVGCEDASVTIKNCTITGNSSYVYGGGVSVFPLAYFRPDQIDSTTTITNCTITENTTNGYGGGVANKGGTLILENTTMYANRAEGWGDDFINEPGYPANYSVSLCAVPAGLTLTVDGKASAITGWYDDGSNVYEDESGEEVTPLRWGDAYNEGYYCSPVETPNEPIITPIALKAAYDINKAHDHVYGNWTPNQDGTHTGHCTVEGCNETKTEDCSGGTPICTSAAVCSVCSGEYGSKNSANHAEYGTELKGEKKATCTTEGYTGNTCCVGCGAVLEEGRVIPSGHSFETDWRYDENDHWHICPICEAVDAKESHIFGDWVITKEATTETEGSREKYCHCGYSIVESIEKIPQINLPKTGDDSKMVLWFALLLISGSAGIALTVYDTNKRKAANSK